MPLVDSKSLIRPAYTIWINGAAGSGKTRAALGFPKVLALSFDPTGLDIVYEPENVGLRENLVWHCSMNGLPLNKVFQVTEEPSEDSLYGCLALARKLAAEGKIETILIDGFTYLANLKWDHICEDEKIETKQGGLDTQKMYGRLSLYLNQFVLSNLLPLATRNHLNVIVTCHVQRESKQVVDGISNPSNPGFERAKRQLNLESDLNPQVLGGFRATVEGLPSALIYFDHKVEADKEGKEVLNYYAYCKKTFVKSLDSQVNAKNRYGLPAVIRLTNANLFRTLLSKLPKPNGDGPNATEVTTTTTANATLKEKK